MCIPPTLLAQLRVRLALLPTHPARAQHGSAAWVSDRARGMAIALREGHEERANPESFAVTSERAWRSIFFFDSLGSSFQAGRPKGGGQRQRTHERRARRRNCSEVRGGGPRRRRSCSFAPSCGGGEASDGGKGLVVLEAPADAAHRLALQSAGRGTQVWRLPLLSVVLLHLQGALGAERV